MPNADVIDWLYERPKFQEELRKISLLTCRFQFPNMVPQLDMENEPEWRYLLTAGSLLAQSERGRHQSAALRIAQYCLVTEGLPDHARAASAVILDVLTNGAAIALAVTRRLLTPDFRTLIPTPLKFDFVRRAVQYSIINNRSEIVQTNRFQKAFWDAAETSNWLSNYLKTPQMTDTIHWQEANERSQGWPEASERSKRWTRFGNVRMTFGTT